MILFFSGMILSICRSRIGSSFLAMAERRTAILLSVGGMKDVQLIGYSVDLHIELFQYVGNRIGRHELNTADDTLKRDIFVGDFCNINV